MLSISVVEDTAYGMRKSILAKIKPREHLEVDVAQVNEAIPPVLRCRIHPPSTIRQCMSD